MLRVAHIRALMILFLSFSSFAVHASTINLFAYIDGSQNVPSNASLGTGTAAITFDDVSNLLSWEIVFSGLSGAATAAHFHGPAAPGVNGDVQVNAAPNGLTSTMIGSATISETQEADLLSGLWYINIHTSMYPAGEIRGQVTVVPVPAAFWLMTSGLVALFGVSRRQRV